MRLIFALLAACLTVVPASAATVFTGTAETAPDGSRFISLDVDLRTFMPSGSAAQVTFEVEGGTLAGGTVDVLNGFDYFVFIDHPPFEDGQDLVVAAVCSFGDVTKCFADPGPLPKVFNPYGTEYLGNLEAAPDGLSYTVTTFRDFGGLTDDVSACIPAVFDSVCAARGRLSLNTIFARVEGDGPISYRATFSNPVAVPEPHSWAMMIAGFGLTGAVLRSRATRRPASPSVN